MTEELKTHLEYIEAAKYDLVSFDEVREAAEDDIRFAVVDGAQWQNWSRHIETRFNGRPQMQLDFSTEEVNRHMAEWATQRNGVIFSPDDDATTPELAENLQGVYRRDYRKSGGQIAIDNAKLYQSLCGYGAWRFGTEYENPGDPEDDRQRIVFHPIDSAHSTVIWQSGSKKIDKSDAKRVSLIEEFDHKILEDEYPGIKKFSSAISPNILQGRHHPGIHKAVFILTVYERKKKTEKKQVWVNTTTREKLFFKPDEVEFIQSELALEGFEYRSTRSITEFFVEKSVIHGDGFLEKPRRIAGEHLPIVPMYGYRGYVGGKEYFYGLIRKKKDPQRIVNMGMSGIVEVAGNKPNAVPLLDPREIKGYEHVWNGDISKKNWLPRKAIVDKLGNEISKPVDLLPPPQIDPNLNVVLDWSSGYLKEKNGGAIDEIKDTQMSGVALRRMYKRANMNTKLLDDNAMVSLKRGGEVYASMAKEVYRIRRSIKAVDFDDSEKVIQLMNPIADPETGKIVMENDFSRGAFEVYADAGQGYDTMYDEALERISALLERITPEDKYYDPLMALFIDSIGDHGFKDLKKFNRRELIRLGLKDPETQEDQQIIQQAGQPTDQDRMNQAMLASLDAEAKENAANAVNKMVDAKKKMAETQKIYSEIGLRVVDSEVTSAAALRSAAGL